MRIVVNTRLLIKDKLEGIGWFTYETLKRITATHPEHEFVFLFDRPPHHDFIFSPNVTSVVLKPQARHPFLWVLWFEFSVHRYLKNKPADLFLSPDGFIPLRAALPKIAVIHDINFHHYPSGIPYLTRLYYNYFFPRFAKEATRIFTVSHFSKSDISNSYSIHPSKISVSHNGANELYNPISDEEKNDIITKYSSGIPYFVFVGALNPRKNVARLILAFDDFLNRTKLEYNLLIVGEPMFMTNDIKQAIKNLTNPSAVVLTGRLKAEELRLVVGAATALAYTPYFEGFGIPLVEAMRCHTPIIASTKTSIPEVAGEAAHYVDPFDINSISKGLEIMATDKKLRDDLCVKAEHRKTLFSWDNTASALYECIEQVIKPK